MTAALPARAIRFPKAVIFDIYRTVLDVSAAPADAELRWERLWMQVGPITTMPTLDDVSDRCWKIVAADHAAAREQGVLWPEVVWPDVIARAIPELTCLDSTTRGRWIFDHQACLRCLKLARGAVEGLSFIRDAGVSMGIASNAQAYTLSEIADVFSGSPLAFKMFDPALCIWSFECGFSKPDPHVFRMLSARLAHRGIRAEEVLMVGDRLDNDIEPSRRIGWQTWHLAESSVAGAGGSWMALAEALKKAGR